MDAAVEGWTGANNRRGQPLAGVVICLVAAGLLVNVYLAVLARVLTEAEYGRFVAFVSVILLISFGGFLPVEQEMARQFEMGHPGGAVLRSGAVVSGGIALVAAGLVLGLIPWLMPTLADEQMITALLVLCAVCVVQFLIRGMLIGTRRMAQHGLILLLDAVLRLSLAATLVTTATRVTAGAFALALVCAIALAHLPFLVWAHRAALRVSGRAEAFPISPAGMARRVGHLITGSLSSQILLNAPPIVVAAVASSGEADVVGRFAATFTLARLLLFVAVPLQSALVPGFTRLANAGDRRARRVLTARIGFGASAVALLTGVLSWWIGPWAIDVVFGPRYGLGSRDVAFMVAGAMLYLGLLVAAQALVGAGLHRLVGATWTMALAVAIALFIAVPNLLLRVELGFAIGSAVGLALALIFLWRATSTRTQRTPLPS